MNLAESLLQGLKKYGVEEIFGIPGDFALPLFKVMEESNILPLYTFSHEPAVGFAADAAARFHSKPSVAAVTYGAGAFNMVNPVAAAYAEKSPVYPEARAMRIAAPAYWCITRPSSSLHKCKCSRKLPATRSSLTIRRQPPPRLPGLYVTVSWSRARFISRCRATRFSRPVPK